MDAVRAPIIWMLNKLLIWKLCCIDPKKDYKTKLQPTKTRTNETANQGTKAWQTRPQQQKAKLTSRDTNRQEQTTTGLSTEKHMHLIDYLQHTLTNNAYIATTSLEWNGWIWIDFYFRFILPF